MGLWGQQLLSDGLDGPPYVLVIRGLLASTSLDKYILDGCRICPHCRHLQKCKKWSCAQSSIQSSTSPGLLRCPEVHTPNAKSCVSQKSWGSNSTGFSTVLLICPVACGYSLISLGQWLGRRDPVALPSAPDTLNGYGEESLSPGVRRRYSPGL